MGLLETTIIGRKGRGSHARVVAELGSAIVSGRIGEGALLPNDAELSLRFGVSRTVLRETMKTLAAKRLIEPKAKVGTRVLARSNWNFFDPDVLGWRCEAGLDPQFIGHLADIRLVLEPAAAAAAALHAGEEDIAALYAVVAAFDNPDHTPATIATVDLDFHLTVARISKNPFMQSAGGLIEAALAISFKLSSPETIDEVSANHLRIADAIAARDTETAVIAMRHVIEEGRDRIQKAMAAA